MAAARCRHQGRRQRSRPARAKLASGDRRDGRAGSKLEVATSPRRGVRSMRGDDAQPRRRRSRGPAALRTRVGAPARVPDAALFGEPDVAGIADYLPEADYRSARASSIPTSRRGSCGCRSSCSQCLSIVGGLLNLPFTRFAQAPRDLARTLALRATKHISASTAPTCGCWRSSRCVGGLLGIAGGRLGLPPRSVDPAIVSNCRCSRGAGSTTNRSPASWAARAGAGFETTARVRSQGRSTASSTVWRRPLLGAGGLRQLQTGFVRSYAAVRRCRRRAAARARSCRGRRCDASPSLLAQRSATDFPILPASDAGARRRARSWLAFMRARVAPTAQAASRCCSRSLTGAMSVWMMAEFDRARPSFQFVTRAQLDQRPRHLLVLRASTASRSSSSC